MSKLRDPEGVRVGDDRGGRVADHDVALAVVRGPLGQQAGLVVAVEHRGDDVAGHLGLDHRDQLRLGAVGVPGRVVGVLRLLALAELVDLVVHAHVLAVVVGEDVRVQQRVVERGVELHLLVGAAAADLHPAQDVVPGVVVRRAHRVEVPPLDLGGQVRGGVVVAGVRDADGRGHRARRGGVEGQVHAVGPGDRGGGRAPWRDRARACAAPASRRRTGWIFGDGVAGTVKCFSFSGAALRRGGACAAARPRSSDLASGLTVPPTQVPLGGERAG